MPLVAAFGRPVPLSPFAYTCAPYSIVSRTTAVYIRRDRLSEGPYVKETTLDRALYCLAAFSITFLICWA